MKKIVDKSKKEIIPRQTIGIIKVAAKILINKQRNFTLVVNINQQYILKGFFLAARKYAKGNHMK